MTSQPAISDEAHVDLVVTVRRGPPMPEVEPPPTDDETADGSEVKEPDDGA